MSATNCRGNMFISARATNMFTQGVTAKTGKKFRYRKTDSIKVQRSIKAKRKILEEKLQLDWAWMPMAAMMNENSTNKLYWTPPVYESNVVEAITKSAAKVPRYRSRKKKLSSSRRRGKLIADGSFIAEDAIEIVESIAAKSVSSTDDIITDHDQVTHENNITRNMECIKKLSSFRRRAKLIADGNFVAEDAITTVESTTDEKITDYDRIIDENNITNHMDSIEHSVTPAPKYGSTKKKKLSSSRRKSRTADDDSITIQDDFIPDDGLPEDCIPNDYILDASIPNERDVTTSQHGSIRKKKLSSSRRRSKLTSDRNSKDEVKDDDTTTVRDQDSNDYCSRENYSGDVNKDTNENVKYDTTQEKQHHIVSTVNSYVKEIDTDSKKDIINMDREMNIHNTFKNNTPIIGQCYQCNSNKPKTLTRGATLLKLMEKFSNMHILPGMMQTKKKEIGLRKVASEPKQTANMKKRRPSIKVYQGYTKQPSTRFTPSIRSSNKKMYLETISIKTSTPVPNKTTVERVNSNGSQSDKAESGIFEESDIDSEDRISNVENLSNAQMRTMLHNLDKFYEEKLSSQDTEIENLRTSVQTQEMLIMQLVHVTMGIKSDFDKLKKNNNLSNSVIEVNEKHSNCEHFDNVRLSNNNPNDNDIIGRNIDMESKSNVLTIKISEN